MRALSLLGVPLLVLLSSARALADRSAPDAPAQSAPIERRGLAVGITGGFSMGTAEGYPNDVNFIGDRTYYGAGGFQVGEALGGHVLGVFAKELSFGVFGTQGWAVSTSGKWDSFGAGAGFRLEVFPFVSLVQKLANLGFSAMFGLGTARLSAREGSYPGAAGAQSLVGVGVFHEWPALRLGHTHFDVGPAVELHVIPTQPMDRATVFVGLRVTFYSGGA
jgi:hypothetical protein